jgi:hypothetical protein
MLATLVGLRMAYEVGVPIDPQMVAELSPGIAVMMSRRKDVLRRADALDLALEPREGARTALDLDAPETEELLRSIATLARRDEDVTMHDVAEAAGLGLVDAVELFGTARRAMALTARLDIGSLQADGWHFLATDPSRAVVDALVSLVRCSRRWGMVTLALLGERSAPASHDREHEDIFRAVPLSDVLVEPLMRLGAFDDRAQCADQCELGVDIALRVALSRPRMAPAQVAELVLRALGWDILGEPD